MAEDDDDFEDLPLGLAPSTLEKALRLPLAVLPFGGVALELLDLAHEQYNSAIARTVGEITTATGAELLIQRIRDDSEVRRRSSKPSAQPREPVSKPSDVRSAR